MPARSSAPLRLHDVRAFVDTTFGDDLHAKRVLSLANGAVRPWDLLDSWVRFVLGVRTEADAL